MSWSDAPEPICTERPAAPKIELTIAARTRSIGDFDVGRILPASARRLVGPFIFFDHMGPAQLAPGKGMDVRPHPHINLATVTYLFEGEILHKDSLGSAQRITPGAINWMSAGRGIVHSERSPSELRPGGPRVHGLQLWVALPKEHEESEPTFSHHPHSTLPSFDDRGVRGTVLAGSAYDLRSPVPVASPLFYVEATLDAGARLSAPDHEERGVYVVSGEVRVDGSTIVPRTMAVLSRGSSAVLEAIAPSRIVMVGGAALEGPRYIFWNFVSSEKERIEHAAHEWREGRFPKIPGDDVEFIPLNEEPRFA